ncbi:MAG: DUF2807 domain-containing protein [Bacteroidia bacterium]
MKTNFTRMAGLALVAVALMSSCTSENLCLKGNEGIQTREIKLSTIDGIDMQIAGNVQIHQGPQAIKVTGHSNVINQLSEDVNGEFWAVKFKDGCYKNYELNIDITVPDLSKVILSGSGDIEIGDFNNQEGLDVLIAGSGNIYLNSFNNATSLNSAINGSGNILFNKDFSVPHHNVSIYGSGEYKAYKVSSKNAKVTLSGSGNCFLNVNSFLDVKLHGSGNVHYRGTPKVNFSIDGSGQVIMEQ